MDGPLAGMIYGHFMTCKLGTRLLYFDTSIPVDVYLEVKPFDDLFVGNIVKIMTCGGN